MMAGFIYDCGCLMSQSGESVVRDILQQQLQAQVLVDGAISVVEDCFYPLLLEEAESTATDSKPFELKVDLLSMLLATLRPAHCYETRQELSRLVAEMLPQLTMALLASSLEKAVVSLLLMDIENLHKPLIVEIADPSLTAIIDGAVASEAERKRECAAHYVGHSIFQLRNESEIVKNQTRLSLPINLVK